MPQLVYLELDAAFAGKSQAGSGRFRILDLSRHILCVAFHSTHSLHAVAAVGARCWAAVNNANQMLTTRLRHIS